MKLLPLILTKPKRDNDNDIRYHFVFTLIIRRQLAGYGIGGFWF